MASGLYNLKLKEKWMCRPYFAGDLAKDNSNSTCQHAHLAEQNRQCPGLRQFLDTPNAGLFLVAGPPGVGKTSLVRRTVINWHREKQNERENQNTQKGQDKKSQLPAPVIVDAGDLGLYEARPLHELERTLITGLLRVLQNSLVPKEKRATLLNTVKAERIPELLPNPRKFMGLFPYKKNKQAGKLVSLQQEVVWLTWLALGKFNGKHAYTNKRGNSYNMSGNVALPAEIPSLGFNADGQRIYESNKSSSHEFALDNNTDALRASLRDLFREYACLDWPVLVIDEWDRFNQVEHKINDSTQSTTENQAPTLEQTLMALGRIKNLLADYPAPVIFVGGEDIYRYTRRNRQYDLYRQMEKPCKDTTKCQGFYTIFQQSCFISPLPAWLHDNDNKILHNPLSAYLKSILTEEPPDELADYLLMEIGPNPHALKVFIGHYASAGDKNSQNNIWLSLPKSKDTWLKAMMGRTLLKELAFWEEQYAGIATAGPYRRLCWLRYLRARLLAYWECVSSHQGNDFLTPSVDNKTSEAQQPPRSVSFLLLLESPDTSDSSFPGLDDLPSVQMLFDLHLWETFYKTVIGAVWKPDKMDFSELGRLIEDSPESEVEGLWKKWGDYKLPTTTWPASGPRARRYKLEELYKRISAC